MPRPLNELWLPTGAPLRGAPKGEHGGYGHMRDSCVGQLPYSKQVVHAQRHPVRNISNL